jgi:hypothetical protein
MTLFELGLVAIESGPIRKPNPDRCDLRVNPVALHDLLRANVREHIQHGAFEFL